MRRYRYQMVSYWAELVAQRLIYVFLVLMMVLCALIGLHVWIGYIEIAAPILIAGIVLAFAAYAVSAIFDSLAKRVTRRGK